MQNKRVEIWVVDLCFAALEETDGYEYICNCIFSALIVFNPYMPVG